MNSLKVFDRATRSIEEEPVYGKNALEFFYGTSWFSKTIGAFLCFCVARFPLFSALYGKIQKLPCSKRKIAPFVHRYKIDPSEFDKRIDQFSSFNDFFTRKLVPTARPLADCQLVLPADARYRIIPEMSQAKFLVKGRAFDLAEFLGSSDLAKKYEGGAMVIARLCPLDYHRFHFPCSGIPGEPKMINGYLYSVNPIALRENWKLLSENRRVLTLMETESMGTVAMVEVGATCVGEIFQTFTPKKCVEKGEEKGYFSFGGSAMVLLFEKGRVTFDPDLLQAPEGLEIVGKMGQPLGN